MDLSTLRIKYLKDRTMERAKEESKKPKKMKRKAYEKELAKLEIELVRLQG